MIILVDVHGKTHGVCMCNFRTTIFVLFVVDVRSKCLLYEEVKHSPLESTVLPSVT